MTKDFNVSVSMNQAAPVKTGVVLKQGDFGFDLKITVLDFTVTGTTPQIVFRKPMGSVESTDVTASGNVYTYTFKGTELDTPGKVFCDLKLKNSTTQRISTASFQFECIADTLDGLTEESSSYSDTIAQIVGGFDDEIANIKNNALDLQMGKLPLNNIIKNQYVGTDGTIKNYTGWDRTEYIPVNNYATITAKTSVSSVYNVFFDAQKTKIGDNFSVGTSDTIISIPQGAVYVMFSNTEAGMDNLTASFKAKSAVDIEALQKKDIDTDTQMKYYNLNNLINFSSLTQTQVNKTTITPTPCGLILTATEAMTANSWFEIYPRGVLPEGIVAGGKYKVIIDGVENCRFQIISYDEESTANIFFSTEESKFEEITIPEDCTNLLIRLRLNSGTTYNQTINIILANAYNNTVLTKITDDQTSAINDINSNFWQSKLDALQLYSQIPMGARSYFDIAQSKETGNVYTIMHVGMYSNSTQRWNNYDGEYNGLCKWDISNPLTPVLVAHNRLFDKTDPEQDGYNPARVAVCNGYVFVACRDAGAGRTRINTSSDDTNGYLFILDEETLTIQTTIKYHGTSQDEWWGKACGVAAYKDDDNSYLAVSLQKAGFVIYNMTADPTNPVEIYRDTPAHTDYGYEVQSGDFFVVPTQSTVVYFALCGFTDGIRFLRIKRSDNTVTLLSTLTLGEDCLGGHSFDIKVKFPYAYATLAPARADIADTSVPRAGILVINISTVSSPAYTVSWIPKDQNTLDATSDTMPTHISMDNKNNLIFENNGDRGVAVFKFESEYIPEFKGNIKRDEDMMHAMISDGFRLYATGTRNYGVFAERPYLTPSGIKIYNIGQ